MDLLRRNLFWAVLGVAVLGALGFYFLAVRRLDAEKAKKEKTLKNRLRDVRDIAEKARQGIVPNDIAIRYARKRKEDFRSQWGRALLYFAMRDASFEEPLPSLNEELWRAALRGRLYERRDELRGLPAKCGIDTLLGGRVETFSEPDPPGLEPGPLVRAHRVYLIQLELLRVCRQLTQEVAAGSSPADSLDARRVVPQINRIEVSDPVWPTKTGVGGKAVPQRNFRRIRCRVSLFVNVKVLNRLLRKLLASQCDFRIRQLTIRRWDRRRGIAIPGTSGTSLILERQIFPRFPLVHPPRHRGENEPPPPICVQLDLELESEDYRGALHQVVFAKGKRWAKTADIEAWLKAEAQGRPHDSKLEGQLLQFVARAIQTWKRQEPSRRAKKVDQSFGFPAGLAYTLREKKDFRKPTLAGFEVDDGVICLFGFLGEKAY